MNLLIGVDRAGRQSRVRRIYYLCLFLSRFTILSREAVIYTWHRPEICKRSSQELVWRCQTVGLDHARRRRALIKGLVTLAYSSCASTNIVVEPIRFKHCLNCVFDNVVREYPQNYLKDTWRNTWSFCSQSRKWQNCWYQALNYEQKVILRTISDIHHFSLTRR